MGVMIIPVCEFKARLNVDSIQADNFPSTTITSLVKDVII